jgi:hypothetical protein
MKFYESGAVYDTVGPLLNVRNAPSPAATSSLALAELPIDVVDKERALCACFG